MNEAKHGSKQPKWGYASSTVGDQLTLRVSRSKAAAPLLGFGERELQRPVGPGSAQELQGDGGSVCGVRSGLHLQPPHLRAAAQAAGWQPHNYQQLPP